MSDDKKKKKPLSAEIKEILGTILPKGVFGDANNKASLAFVLKENKSKVIGGGIGLLVVLFALTRCGNDDGQYITLSGKEAIQSGLEADNLLNQEQAEFDRQRRLNQTGDALDIGQADKLIIIEGEFTPEQISNNTGRFKPIETETHGQLYVDIQTNQIYNTEGHIVDYQHEPAYIEQAPIEYSNLSGEQAGASFQRQAQYGSEQVQAEQQTQGEQTPQSISPQLQSTLVNLDTANEYTFNTLTAIDNQRIQQQQVYQAQIQAQQAQAQAQIAGMQAQASQKIGEAIGKMYQPSAFSNNTNTLTYRGSFNTAYFNPTTDKVSGSANNMVAKAPDYLLPNGVLRQGTIILVAVTSDVNTDKSSVVSGIILDGYYAGAKVQGVLVQKPRNIGVVFDKIFPVNPRLPVINFSGLALDLTTNQDGVATSIHNHYLQNYSGIIAKSILTGYGNAYSGERGTTTINRSDGTIITTKEGKVSKDEIRGQVYSDLSARLNQETVNWGNRKPTYKIKQGTVLAVQLQDNLDTRPQSHGAVATEPVQANNNAFAISEPAKPTAKSAEQAFKDELYNQFLQSYLTDNKQ